MASTHRIFVTIRGTVETSAPDAEAACDQVEGMSLGLLIHALKDVEVETEYEAGPEPEYEHEDKLEQDLD